MPAYVHVSVYGCDADWRIILEQFWQFQDSQLLRDNTIDVKHVDPKNKKRGKHSFVKNKKN